MESKLKSLKVADLRDILAKAQQPAPPKSTKPDLVSRIIASKEATQVYNAKFAPKDDLLAPPEDLDWDVDQKPHAAKPETVAAKPAPKTATQSTQAPAPAPASVAAPAAAPAPDSSAPAPTDDVELEKRKKRAERFGIPLVESRSSTAKKKGAAAPAATAPEVPDNKLQARAARFGTGQKRAAPLEEVDAEELERRRKRAERFGQQG
ncbi:hypothetical protein GGX14DRAFT_630506 [Mycena pura]|uniref:THO1-MOS11 C-terminal domain-containing protein n=1 Tax=Mycena pura TaxID=153505 RepID=A0AAD6VD62_9AGAR|nr:hypothetical protein GGX14DRAFT_630506 [Mycena pura]